MMNDILLLENEQPCRVGRLINIFMLLLCHFIIAFVSFFALVFDVDRTMYNTQITDKYYCCS